MADDESDLVSGSDNNTLTLIRDILSGLRRDLANAIRSQTQQAIDTGRLSDQLTRIEGRLIALESARKPPVLHPVVGLALGAIFATAIPPLVHLVAHSIEVPPAAIAAPPAPDRKSLTYSSASP